MVTTDGHLLGGRLTYRQPESGFRSGIEPVLLAAATPARPGESVLEAGTGAGAALLCLHARIRGLRSVGVEADPEAARLAAVNAEANAFADMEIIEGHLDTIDLQQAFHHAIANPPYHPTAGTPSPVATREKAKRGSCLLIESWVNWLALHLRNRGTLTLIVTAAMVPACLAAMEKAKCAPSVVFPLWPMVGRAAKLVIIRGIKNSRAPMRLVSGLVLHAQAGAFTEITQTILRDATTLDLS